MLVQIPFRGERQQQDNWCWAAGSTGIERYYGRNQWSQCALANHELQEQTCCFNGATTQCDQPWYVNRSLSTVACYGGYRPGPLSMNELFKEIDQGDPVGIGIRWRDGSGHFVVAFGADSSSDVVLVADSVDETISRVSYDQLCGSYNGTDGTWGDVYFCRDGYRAPPRLGGRPSGPVPEYRVGLMDGTESMSTDRTFPIFTARLDDAAAGRTLSLARRTGSLQLQDDGIVSAGLGGETGIRSGGRARDEATDLELIASRASGAVRILKIPGLYATVAWLVGERDGEDELVTIGRVPRFLREQGSYTVEEFERTVQPAAERRLAFVTDEQAELARLRENATRVDPFVLGYARLHIPNEWQTGEYQLVASDETAAMQWNILCARVPIEAREAFERISAYPTVALLPSRQFPIRPVSRYRNLWRYELISGDAITYRVAENFLVML